jgi:3-(3-hydroxy-phenyl)propionate hydroxylase
MTTYDVAIVGYGPVGATLAALLGRSGLSVAVIEAQREIYDKPRAISIDHEALRILQRCGLTARLPELIGPHRGTHYLGVDGQLIRIFDPAPPPYRLGWSPNGTFIQPELEGALREAVARLPSVRVLSPCEATAVAPDEEGVTLTVRSDGKPETLRARYLVGCDGGNSFVRKQLDLPLEDLAYDEYWMVVDALLKGDAELPPRAIQYCQPSRPATFVPGPKNLRRWEIRVLPGERPEEFASDENILRQLSRFVNRNVLTIWRTAVYRFHALVARRWRAGRCFIAGDAAHQMPPFLGQGLCSGVRDAANLAWKLDLVLRRGAQTSMLDTYETERKPHIRELVEITKAFGRVISELDPAAARKRDAEMEAQLKSGKAETVRQRFIPGLLDGIIDRDADSRPAKAAGTLFVQPRVKQPGGDALLEEVVGPGFLVVTRTGGSRDWLTADSRALLQRIGGACVTIGGADGGPGDLAETDGLFALWCRENDCEAAIVRPDRYVYGIANDAASLNRQIGAIGRQLFG